MCSILLKYDMILRYEARLNAHGESSPFLTSAHSLLQMKRKLVKENSIAVGASNIPLHMIGKPLHVLSGWHVLMVDPLRTNPGSHLKSTLLGNTVEAPEEVPFLGTGKGPQSTAKKKKNDYDLHCSLVLSTGLTI